jgi:glucose/mannose-6-phosphate isomerase
VSGATPELRPAGLDDPAELEQRDPGGMLGEVAGAGQQTRVALRAAQAAPLVGPLPEVVVVAGMGGSGIAGDVLAALAFASSAVPVLAVKGDRLPAFVGPGTLLVAVSYSGNTAETVTAVEQGLAAGARLVAVTSGGALAELASSRGAPLVTIEGGRMPRAALWSLVVPVCSAAEAAGILPPLTDQICAAADTLDEEATALDPKVPTSENPAKRAALRLLDRLPMVWGSGQLGAVAATSFRTQCNENAKISSPARCRRSTTTTSWAWRAASAPAATWSSSATSPASTSVMPAGSRRSWRPLGLWIRSCARPVRAPTWSAWPA